MRKGILLLLLVAVTFGLCAEDNFYVDGVFGNDSWEGKSDIHTTGNSGPKKTIQAAIELASGTKLAVIKVAPGHYSTGAKLDGDATIPAQSNRVVITKPLIHLKSTLGAAETFIEGFQDPTVTNGVSGGASVRPILIKLDSYANHAASNIVIEGFTICNGAAACLTADSNRGGGIAANAPEGKSAAVIVDCVISNNAAVRGGGAYRVDTYRSWLLDNFARVCGSAQSGGSSASCVMAFNRGEGAAAQGLQTAVGCTVARNDGYAVQGDVPGTFCNMLVFGNGNNGDADIESLIVWHDSITAGEEFSVVSTAIHDWHLREGVEGVGRGAGAWYETYVHLPAGFDRTDIYGSAIDQAATIDCGAAQGAVATASGALCLEPREANYLFDDGRFIAYGGSYHFTTNWPEVVRMRPLGFADGALLHHTYTETTESRFGETPRQYFDRPNPEGYLRLAVPAAGEALTNVAVRATAAFYVDGVNGSDFWNGKFSTHITGTQGPKKTLIAAMELAREVDGEVLVCVAPGDYTNGYETVMEDVGYETRSRLRVGGKIGLVATGGAAVTFLTGAADPAGPNGCGSSAVRCLWMEGDGCFAQGFTLRSGHTFNIGGDLESISAGQGAAIYGASDANAWVFDCQITTNFGYGTSGIAKSVNLKRCWVYGNVQTYGAAFSEIRAFSSIFGPQSLMTAEETRRTMFTGENAFFACTIDNLKSADSPFYDHFRIQAVATLLAYSGEVTWNAFDSVYTGNPGYSNPDSDDYSIGSLSPAARLIDVADYASSKLYHYGICGDIYGRAIPFRKGKAPAGAVYNEFVPMYAIDLVNGGAKVDGGAAGTNFVLDASTITVTASTLTSRPFLGIEVDGVMLDPTQTSYRFKVSPDMQESPVVRVIYSNKWYVDYAGGRDSYSGVSLESAKKHIYAAMTNAIAGDTILVAPGTYGEEEMPRLSGQNRVIVDPARKALSVSSLIVIPAGVTLKSLEGAAKTTLLGRAATASPDELDNGVDAVRCVMLDGDADTDARRSTVEGFTLTGGHTSYGSTDNDDLYGGAVLSRQVGNRIIGCVISNNFATRATAAYAATFRDCLIKDNYASGFAAGGVNSKYWRTIFAGNRSNETLVRSGGEFDSCTVFSNNTTLAEGDVVALDGTDSGEVRNTLSMIPFHSSIQKFSYSLLPESTPRDGVFFTECIFTNAEAMALDNRYVPIPGANAGSDRGNYANVGEFAADNLDFYGNLRVMNGAMDIGAVEYDWRPKYSADISAHVSVTNVSGEVYENADERVYIPKGQVTMSLNSEGSGTKIFNVGFSVTGYGVCKVYLNGEAAGTYVKRDEPYAADFVFKGDSASLQFVYEPGFGDIGGVVLGQAKTDNGFIIFSW